MARGYEPTLDDYQLIWAIFLSFFLRSRVLIGQSEDTQQKKKRDFTQLALLITNLQTCVSWARVSKAKINPWQDNSRLSQRICRVLQDAHVERWFRSLQKAERATYPCASSCLCLTQDILLLCLIFPTAVNRDDSSSLTPLGAEQTKSYSL